MVLRRVEIVHRRFRDQREQQSAIRARSHIFYVDKGSIWELVKLACWVGSLI